MIRIMEVCGTHTMSIFRSGLKSRLPENIKLLSGPGCPVCVTSQGEIDWAISLAEDEKITIATFGDMVRVPGSRGSLSDMRSRGRSVKVVLSAMESLELAMKNPSQEVVFLAVGFETTAPSTAATLIRARELGVKNFSVLSFHKTVPPVLKKLASRPVMNLDGLLLPGHVAVILGHEPFRFLPEDYGLPSVISGFEPSEILDSIAHILEQIEKKAPKLESCYDSAVRKEGNPLARELMERVFVNVSSKWRGLGEIESSGLDIGPEFKAFDGKAKFPVPDLDSPEPKGCICGSVLSGDREPSECPLFEKVCTPFNPVGPCMVSSEGTCSAWFLYGRKGEISWES